MISRALSALRVASTNGSGNAGHQPHAARAPPRPSPAARRRSRRCRSRRGRATRRARRAVNATPSAVPCTSTKRPSPVITTFMSTSARTSSEYSRSSIGMPSITPTEIAAHGCSTGWRPSDLGRDEPAARVVQRDPPAADRRGARAAVGLQHVAVDGELHVGHRPEVGDRAQRPADQPLDLLRAPALLALRTPRASTRSGDEPGSIEYSAVTQPLPEFFSHGGTRLSSDAVHSTRVRPNSTSTEPAAISV